MPSWVAVLRFRILSGSWRRSALFLAALAVPSCNRQAPSPAPPAQVGGPGLARVESRQIRWRVGATGTVQPVKAVTLSTQQPGTGDILAEFERTSVATQTSTPFPFISSKELRRER